MTQGLFRVAYSSFQQKIKSLTMHVTAKCDFSCPNCFVRERNRGLERELSFDEFAKISQQLGKIEYLNISGGEPFQRDDLKEICRVFATNNTPLWLSIPTNCSHPERIEDTVHYLLQNIRVPISIDLSVDHIHEMHDEIRGHKGSFEKILNVYSILTKMQEKYPQLKIKILTLVQNQNANDLHSIYDYVLCKMPQRIFHSFILSRPLKLGQSKTLLSLDKIKSCKQVIEKIYLNELKNEPKSFSNHLIHTLRLMVVNYSFSTVKRKESIFPCRVAYNDLVIWANADVSFCEMGPIIGNLCDYNFDIIKLRKSTKSNEEKKRIQKERCFCIHDCSYLSNLMFNPVMYLRVAFYYLYYHFVK